MDRTVIPELQEGWAPQEHEDLLGHPEMGERLARLEERVHLEELLLEETGYLELREIGDETQLLEETETQEIPEMLELSELRVILESLEHRVLELPGN